MLHTFISRILQKIITWAARRRLLPRLYHVFFRRDGQLIFGGCFSSLEMTDMACDVYHKEWGSSRGLIFVSCQNIDWVAGDDPEIPGLDIGAEINLMEREQDERAAAADGMSGDSEATKA